MNLYLQIAALLGSIVIGGFLVELFKKPSHLKLLLSFSGGFLLTLIFIHILPETYEEQGFRMGYFILVGFLLQLALEYFSRGAEHGHTHAHHDTHKTFPIAIFLSLSVHAFIETLPLDSGHGDHAHIDQLYWGILLHKIPVGVALMSILRSNGYSNKASWIYVILFSLVAPVGLLCGGWLVDVMTFELDYLLAIVVGMLIHISTTIIFESSESHRINFLKLAAIILGFGAAAAMGGL